MRCQSDVLGGNLSMDVGPQYKRLITVYYGTYSVKNVFFQVENQLQRKRLCKVQNQ